MKSTASKPPKRRKFVETIYISTSKQEGVQAGMYYAVFKRRDEAFIFNESGQKVVLDPKLFQWETLDHAVMVVRAITSHLDSIKLGNIYRVFDDVSNDERYIFDDNREKVLFDENIFTWEVV